MAIDKYDTVIKSSEVTDRIEELEDEDNREFEVVRDRNNEVVYSGDDQEECNEYIDDEDLDPSRFTVRVASLDEEDAEELKRLKDLLDEADGALGRPWTIYRDAYFTGPWAQERAREEFPSLAGKLDYWPFSQIDWDEAATEKRDSDYSCLSFDGEDYYGA